MKKKTPLPNSKVYVSQVFGGIIESKTLSQKDANHLGILNPLGYDLLASCKYLKKPYACPTCKLSVADLEATGRFGCPDCYTTFRDVIIPFLSQAHSGDVHTGKTPENNKQKKEENRILQLKKTLSDAIKGERFEEAAEVRDLICEIESTL